MALTDQASRGRKSEGLELARRRVAQSRFRRREAWSVMLAAPTLLAVLLARAELLLVERPLVARAAAAGDEQRCWWLGGLLVAQCASAVQHLVPSLVPSFSALGLTLGPLAWPSLGHFPGMLPRTMSLLSRSHPH